MLRDFTAGTGRYILRDSRVPSCISVGDNITDSVVSLSSIKPSQKTWCSPDWVAATTRSLFSTGSCRLTDSYRGTSGRGSLSRSPISSDHPRHPVNDSCSHTTESCRPRLSGNERDGRVLGDIPRVLVVAINRGCDSCCGPLSVRDATRFVAVESLCCHLDFDRRPTVLTFPEGQFTAKLLDGPLDAPEAEATGV